MAYRNQKSQKLYITSAPQPTINTPVELAASFMRFKTQPIDTPVPQPTMVTDEGEVGDGVGYAQNVRLYNWPSIDLSLQGRMNDYLMPVLFARCLGGTVVDAAVTAAASYDHTIPMATELELVQPKLSTVITEGAAKFIWADVFVKNFSISQEGDEEPTWQASLGNSGLWKEVADSAIVLSSVPALSSNYLGANYHGAATRVTYNDGAAQDLTASRGLCGVSVQIDQPVDVINLPGDDFITADDVNSGSYSATLMRGTQNADIVRIKVYADTPLAQWVKMVANTVLTNFTVKFTGKKIGATTDSYETEVVLSRAMFMSITPTKHGEYEAFDCVVRALPDVTNQRLCTGRVRNGTATLS
ncbi:MAG: hypothetical protein ACK4S4_15825 [Pyrinomonadaceae bacterium]